MGALLGIVDLLPEDRAIEHQVKPVIPTPEPQKQVKKSPKLELRHLLEESWHDILGLTTVNFDESNNIVASLEDTSKQFEEMVYKYIRSRFLSEQDDSYVVTFDRCIDTFMNVFHIQYIGEQRAIYFSFDYAWFERLERDLKHRTFKDGKPIITDLFPQFLSYLRDESAIQEYFANHFTEEVEQSDGIMIHFIPRTNFNMKDEQKKLSGANEWIKKWDTSDNPDAIGMETDLEEIWMVAKDPLMVEWNVDPHELVESDYR